MNKKHLFAFSPLTQAFILAALLPESYAYAASNFSITTKAGTTLPTTVSRGQTVTAYFTVKNNTKTARNGYSIVGLPRTVTQDSSGTNCQSMINLNGNASCTLALDIIGEAKGNFAICKGNSCTTSCVGLNVSVINSINLVAAGQYSNAGAVQFPLLAHSTNTSAWSYPITSNPSTLPANFSSTGQFLSASCSGNICIAGGSYLTLTLQYPLLANSSDGGTTWHYPGTIITNLPSDYVDAGVFNGVSCYGSTCVAAGEDFNGSGAATILAQSNDAGTTWNYPIGGPGTLPTDFGPTGQFNAVSCDSQSCVVAGRYTNTGFIQYPLLSQATLGQTNWTYRVDSAGVLPADFSSNGIFNASSCSGNICIVGGTYDNTINTFPLLGLSTNGGINWTYPIYSGGSLPADYVNSGVFNGVSCFGQICIAGGTYSIGGPEVPFLAQSTNGGTSWTYPIYAGGGYPPVTLVGGAFSSASCASNICIAAGSYSDGFTLFPLLAQTIDGGATWTYPVTSASNLPPNFSSSGIFSSASCGSQNTCIAVGTYNSTTVSGQLLLIETTDGGVTWTYPSSIISQQPADFTTGSFSGASVTPFAKKMKGLTSQIRDALKITAK